MTTIESKMIGLVIELIERHWNALYNMNGQLCCDSYCFNEFQCQAGRTLSLHELIVNKKLQLAFVVHMLGFVKLSFK